MPLVIRTTGIEDYLDPDGDTYVKALVLGPPSAGKTRSASFWPKALFADCEQGRMSIADRKVPYGDITSQEDMKALIRMMRVEAAKPKAQRRVLTFVLDTLDAYQRIVIQERLRDEKKEALSGFADWGYLDAKMTQLVTELLSLPMNIVVNVHTKETGGGDDPTITGVKLKGDIKDQIAAEFDFVGLMGVHYEAIGGERVLTRSIKWHPEPNVPILKDRSGRLPKFTPVNFAETDYTQLLEPLRAAVEGLEAGGEMETLEVDSDTAPEPVAPRPGGAVSAPTPAPAKKAPAKKAPAKAPAVEVVEQNVPDAAPTPVPAPAPAAPAPASVARAVPAAAKPVPAPGQTEPTPGGAVDPATGEQEVTFVQHADAPATHEEAVERVVDGIGGEVVAEQGAEDPAWLAKMDEPADEDATTPVVEPEAPAPPPASATRSGAPTCGTAGKNKDGSVSENPVSGCGKDLSTESKDVVNIGFIRTAREGRATYLCPACIAAHKAAAAS